jgi:hypothetical protein
MEKNNGGDGAGETSNNRRTEVSTTNGSHHECGRAHKAYTYCKKAAAHLYETTSADRKIELFFAAVVAVATFVYMAVSIGQLIALHRQLAETSADFRIERQPWVSVKAMTKIGEFLPYQVGTPKPPSDKAGTIQVTFLNSGATPAFDMTIYCAVRVLNKGEPLRFSYDIDTSPEYSKGILAPQQMLNCNANTYLRYLPTSQFSIENANTAGDAIAYGYVEFADRFRKRYCSIYCAHLIPIFGHSIFRNCERYNNIYEEDRDHPCPPDPDSADAQ